MKIEIDGDTADELVRQVLKEAYDDAKYVKKQFPRFSNDLDIEMEHIYELRKALRLVHNYFSTRDQKIEWTPEW